MPPVRHPPAPGDTAVLQPGSGCSCWARSPLCQGEILFGFLAPGDYVLTLYRSCGSRVTLRVVLPPGGNVEIFCRRDCCRWRRDSWQYLFNRC